MGERFFLKELKCRVIKNLATLYNPAVTMACVLTHAYISDDQEFRYGILDGLYCRLDNAVGVEG
ncbi:hypothetical protein BMS3Bbin07_00428 [bacterium BMS3Bbin07]|nr:hypothetical protein BMS3Bbin07_00428 [bacterium BMS3Bbin07]